MKRNSAKKVRQPKFNYSDLHNRNKVEIERDWWEAPLPIFNPKVKKMIEDHQTRSQPFVQSMFDTYLYVLSEIARLEGKRFKAPSDREIHRLYHKGLLPKKLDELIEHLELLKEVEKEVEKRLEEQEAREHQKTEDRLMGIRSRYASRVASRYLEDLSIFDTLPKKKVRVRPSEMKKLASDFGDCYEANGKYFMDNAYRNPKLRLVHGEVMGQGELQGVSYGHCWCEDGGEVLDFSNGRNIKIDKRVYYALGQIDRFNNAHVYDHLEFSEMISTHGHWGPWDLKTKTGL